MKKSKTYRLMLTLVEYTLLAFSVALAWRGMLICAAVMFSTHCLLVGVELMLSWIIVSYQEAARDYVQRPQRGATI